MDLVNRPGWLDDKFIKNCLQDGDTSRPVQVITYEISPAVAAGNNFASNLWRLHVEYSDSEQKIMQASFVVKAPLTDGLIKDLHENFSFVEPLYYKQFLPIAFKMSEAYYFAPKSYFSENPNIIILEDLKAKGFVMEDRCKQLDFDHCCLYAAAAATMHAASIAIQKQERGLVDKLGCEKVFCSELESSKPVKLLIEKGMEYFSEQLKKISHFEQFSDLINNLSKRIWNLLADLDKPNYTLNALIQGDPWTANMMFKYNNSGQVAEAKLLDFQALRYTTPVFDLIFFIWTSANDEVRENKLAEFYQIYCNVLNTRLETYNCSERLTFDQLQDTLKVLNPYVVVCASCFYPFITHQTPIDMGEYFKELVENKTSILSKCFNEDFCQTKLPRLLKQMEATGVFRYVQDLLK